MTDFIRTDKRLMGILSHMDEKELYGEYMILQACYKAYDDMSEKVMCLNPMIIDYMDFLEMGIFQEICKRFCATQTNVSVPTYDCASDET